LPQGRPQGKHFCLPQARPQGKQKNEGWETVVDTNEQLRRGKTTYAHSLSPLYFRCKKLSLQYCLKLNCNYNNPAYATVFNSNFTLYLKENPLNYLLLQSVFQVIYKRLVSKRVMLLHLLYQPHRLGF